jgi:hypothetical protein
MDNVLGATRTMARDAALRTDFYIVRMVVVMARFDRLDLRRGRRRRDEDGDRLGRRHFEGFGRWHRDVGS